MSTDIRIFDADTHVGPTMDVLEQYLDSDAKEKLPAYDEWRKEDTKKGAITYTMGVRTYSRPLTVAPESLERGGKQEYLKGFVGALGRAPERDIERDAAARIRDLDLEGVHANLLLPSGWFGSWTAIDDVDLEVAMHRSYHRWMRDYCGKFPDRLTGVILASGRDVPAAVKEIEAFGGDQWAMGVLCYAPYGMPLDHPDLEPIWAASQQYNLTIVLHTFTAMPPYAPGGLDTWDNLWLQRSAAHPWCGMRNMAAILGAGILDRYPQLRLAVLEAGHGWLPFWVKRLDEHVKTMTGQLPDLQMLPSEYVVSGRYFQSIEISEGLPVTQAVIDILGHDVLMYGSDYPHSESAFPDSVHEFMKWDLSGEDRRKMLWDNPVRCYARYADIDARR